MTPAFEKLQKHLKQLPGLGYRSSERIALHLLVEKPAQVPALVTALEEAARAVRRCARCGNLAEGDCCENCADERRAGSVVCVVEHVPDLVALERSGAYRLLPLFLLQSELGEANIKLHVAFVDLSCTGKLPVGLHSPPPSPQAAPRAATTSITCPWGWVAS